MTVAGESDGSASVVVLIGDTAEAAMDELEDAILSALRHFGVPFLCTTAVEAGESFAYFCNPLLLVPQSGTLARLSERESEGIQHAVESGMGLVFYEPEVCSLPSWLRRIFRVEGAASRQAAFSDMITTDNSHFISWTRWIGERVRSDRPLRCATGLAGQSPPSISTEAGDPLMYTARYGAGGIAAFPFDAKWYTMEYLGHACGADDIFFRSIVWAARKPFLTWSMPAKAGLVVDDCSGSYDHFGYLRIMERHGWRPYLSLFTDTIDEVAHEDIHKTARVLHDGWANGMIDIGFHALRYNDSYCFNHPERRPLTREELEDRFVRWDACERTWGIRHSTWAHPHFGEIGANAVPYFMRRGIAWITYLLPLDAAWFDVPTSIPPLSGLPPFGHPGYHLSELPGFPDMMACNCVLDDKDRKSSDYVAKTDYLWNHTPFWSEAPEPLLEASAQVLALQIRRGLDAGLYGEGATHEQRIACLRSGELEEIFQEADRLLSRYDFQRCFISRILTTAKKRQQSRLMSVSYGEAGNHICCTFSTADAIGTQVQLYTSSEPQASPRRMTVDACEFSAAAES